jgi:Uma2 family endonuclease
MATRLSPVAAPGEISFEDFLTRYDSQHAEWVAGVVVPVSPASDRHQDLVGFLQAILRPFVERAGGAVRAGPYVMRLRDAAREPDLMAVTAEHRDRLTPGFLNGAADLAIEVISPDSRARDRGEKFYEYEQAGVHEYWLIDPARKKVEQYRLGAGGTFDAVVPGDPARLVSEAFPGLWVEVDWLWSEPLPDVFAVFRAWGLT